MDFTNIRVLVPESGKQALAMVRGLKELNCHVTIIAQSKLNACYASKLPDSKIIYDSLLKDPQKTYEFLLNENFLEL